MIDPKTKGKPKQKPIVKSSLRSTKPKRTDAEKPKQITLLSTKTFKEITVVSNQTLHIKLPEDYKNCKIEFV